MIEKFFPCDCHTEGLRVCYDPDDGAVYLSIWQDGYQGAYPWRDRVRHIWQIIKTGRPWEDQLVMRRESVAPLAQFLLDPENR